MTSALSSVGYTADAPALAADGFSDGDIARLDALVADLLGAEGLGRLARMVRGSQNLDDEGEVAAIGQEWMQRCVRNGLGRRIYDAGFPNADAASCYVMREAGQALRNAVAMEAMRRQLAAEPAVNWEMDPADVALGKVVADEGLAKDAKTWPVY